MGIHILGKLKQALRANTLAGRVGLKLKNSGVHGRALALIFRQEEEGERGEGLVQS
jgi:hypothetical protein